MRDAELVAWLENASTTQDGMAFQFIICAAATAGRPLPTSLLPAAAEFVPDPYQLAWIAWHMEGDVVAESVRAAENPALAREKRAAILFYATAW
ncbi:MAG: hypothetical protein ABI992_06965, partial [Chthoniobacterales bacterium]